VLKKLRLKQVGPAPEFDVEFAERLNIFTGDNGLGKTFLLDIAWWTLTGNWIDQPAYPQRQGQPEITCHVDSPTASNNQDYHSSFDFDEQQWRKLLVPDPFKGIVIYARADGSFSVFDSARKRDTVYRFTPDTLWNGLRSGKKVLCKGLIDDWVKWQIQPDKTQFNLLSQVIHKLAPHPGEWIEPGEPTRISVEDVRDIPTVNLPFGWLTSEIFGLKQARSKQAEPAIEAAEAWMRHDDMSNFPDDLRTKEQIHQQLLHLLPGHDPFFPRWIVTMEKR
jgi:hypothetical protein